MVDVCLFTYCMWENLYPLVPGDFFGISSQIGEKLFYWNKVGNPKAQSHGSFLHHARGQKKSVLQSTGGLYPQLTLSKYDL